MYHYVPIFSQFYVMFLIVHVGTYTTLRIQVCCKEGINTSNPTLVGWEWNLQSYSMDLDA